MATTPHFHRKSDPKRGTVGVRLVLSMLTLFQHPPRGPFHGAKQISKTYNFSDMATQSRFPCAPMLLHSDFNAHLMLNSCNWHWKHVHACPKSSVAHPKKCFKIIIFITKKHHPRIVLLLLLGKRQPLEHYVVGGGWELYKRIRGDPSRLTLPYLTLPYLTLN